MNFKLTSPLQFKYFLFLQLLNNCIFLLKVEPKLQIHATSTIYLQSSSDDATKSTSRNNTTKYKALIKLYYKQIQMYTT